MATQRPAGTGRHRAQLWWSVRLIAAVVVMAAPAVSVATLTSLVGAWFVVMGLLEMLGALLLGRDRLGEHHRAARLDRGPVRRARRAVRRLSRGASR